VIEPNVNGKAALEAVLLSAPAPARLADLAEALEAKPEEVSILLAELAAEYDRDGRGFAVQAVAGGYRLVSRPAYAGYVVRYLKPQVLPGLTPAALETLAIVAYRQPVTKVEIEAIRGVRVDKPLNTLLERGVIRELGRKEGIGRPILYGTTSLFLEHFGLGSLADLPGLEEGSAERAAVEAAASAQGEPAESPTDAAPSPDEAGTGRDV
jgi:segregation and condensation protein B